MRGILQRIAAEFLSGLRCRTRKELREGLGTTRTRDADRSGKERPRRKTDGWGPHSATLVLGLLEMKGEGFFRRAPRQDQITCLRRSYGLGSNVDRDSNVGAFFLPEGALSRGPPF